MPPFPQTTAEWCHLLAAPGAPIIQINAENEGRGTCSFKEALEGGSFGVIIRSDVVAVDVDDDREWVFPALLDHLAECGQEYLAFKSGRPGHFHLLLVCWSEPHALTAARGLRIFLDTVGRPDVVVRHRQLLRPPGAPHRLGLPTSCTPVAWSAGALARLQSARSLPWRSRSETDEPLSVALLTVDVIDSTPAVVSELTSRERGSLDRATYDLLVHGEGLDRYRSRSEVVFVLCRGMYRAGWSEDDAVQALYNKSHRGAEAWRSINSGVPGRSGGIRKRPRRWLRSVWAAAARSAEAQPSHRRGSNEFVDGSLSEWLESVEDIIRSSAPKRLSTVMLVASHLAANAGEDVQSCRGSLRSIAERCCLDTGTVHTAVRDLESYGLLETLAVGGVEVSGGGVGRTTASEWRLVTVSDMGGTPRPGAEKGAMRRTALPVSYRELDGSLSPAARWLLMRLLESELALDECAELLLMRQRSLLLAQRDRTRGGALRQLLDLGLVRQTASGTFTARAEPTKKAAAAARQVRFHGRRATDRRRRMQVRHRQQRVQAVLTLKMAKRLRMEARITEHYVARRWLEPSRATRIAVATVRVRLGEAPVAQVCRSGRSHVVACDDGTEQRYWVEADEVVIVPGDASVTRRAGRAGARKVWALRHPYLGAPKPAWTVTGRIVNASKLVEALRDLDGPGVRLERVVPDAGDRMLVLEELLPLATPSERMQLGVA